MIDRKGSLEVPQALWPYFPSLRYLVSHLTAGGTFFLPQAPPPKIPGEHPTKMSTSGALPYFLGLSGGYPASMTLAVTGLTPNLLGDPSRNAHFGGPPPRNFRRCGLRQKKVPPAVKWDRKSPVK